jgi:hypothetical protein
MLNFGFRRKKSAEAVTGGNDVLDISYNRYAGALKMINLAGQLTPIGSLVSAVNLPDRGALVAIFNPSASATVYVKFGDDTVTAPADGATGIAIPAGQYVSLSSGQYQWVIASALCYGYVIEDDSFLAPIPTT